MQVRLERAGKMEMRKEVNSRGEPWPGQPRGLSAEPGPAETSWSRDAAFSARGTPCVFTSPVSPSPGCWEMSAVSLASL